MFLEQKLANPKWAHSFSGMFWSSMVFYGGSPPSPPPPPPPPEPPNYAAANSAAVEADVRSLPARRQVENLAKLGGAGTVSIPTYSKDGSFQGYNNVAVDFRGKSDVDVAKEIAKFQREESRNNAQAALDLQGEYGTKFAEQAKSQLQTIDPTGYANREMLGQKVANTTFEGVTDGPTFTRNSSGPSYEMISDGPSLARQSYGPQFQAGDANAGGGAAAAGRAEIERQLGENLFNNGKLTDEQARRLNNSVRGAQTARGNIYGNAPTAQEILTRSGAETEMARQARSDVVGYLQSGQSSYDIANAIRQESNQLAQQGYMNYSTANSVNNALAQQEFQNQQASLGQRNQAQQSMYQNELSANTANNQLSQQAYGNQLAAVQQRNAATQQGIANLQSYAGLQPIVTQGGQLGGLGQGAAPTIQTPIPQGVNVNPVAGQMGSNFALGVYGNQTSQYNSLLDYNAKTYSSQMQYAQANSPLSWITGIGGVLF
jgi:hypothetical protein